MEFSKEIIQLTERAEKALGPVFAGFDEIAYINTMRVLESYRRHRVSETMFAGSTGYGYGDTGRDTMGEIYADVFGAETAFVRHNIVNGTQAISTVLFGLLRPGDIMLSVTGRPYDTLSEVIGDKTKNGDGSLADFGVLYDEVVLLPDGSVDFEDMVGSSFAVKKELPYSTFLKEVQNKTNIPITIAHAAFAEYFKDKSVPDKYFSKQTLQHFVAKYREWYITTFAKRYSYEKIDVAVNDPLREIDGTPKKAVLRTDIGVLPQGDIESGKNVLDNYLYDACCYDSALERENIVQEVLSDIAEVEVFGKIPKRTVRIPTYADGTYSPDFMYVVKRKDGKRQLNLVVETKDKTELDPEEMRKIKCAQKLFEEMQKQQQQRLREQQRQRNKK